VPSRGTRFEPARRQGRFEGSFRQRRSHVLRTVAGAGSLLAAEVDAAALSSLVADGLIVADGGWVRLPD